MTNTWLRLAVLFAGLAGTVCGTQPNVVVVMADDLDVPSLQLLLHAGLMPNLQRHILNRGTTFSQAFVSDSVCCPSRATFLTGQYPHNHGTLTNNPITGAVTQFKDAATLATFLHAAGYRTGLVGKYLNGYGTADANRDGKIDLKDLLYIPPGWDDWQTLIEPYTGRMYQFVVNDNGRLVAHGDSEADYQTDVLASRAIRFISDAASANPDQPFFLFVTPLAPHQEVWPNISVSRFSDAWKWTLRPAPRHIGTVNLPLPRGPSFNEADVTDKPFWLRGRPVLTTEDIASLGRQQNDRLASMRAVDDLIGSIATKLVATGDYANTVFIFTSDNGFFLGEHRLPQKMAAYEEAIRVPLAISAPGFTAPQTSEAYVLNNDLSPTILQLAGATSSFDMDGRSLVPLLSQGGTPWRQRFLIEHWPGELLIIEIPRYLALRTHPSDLYTPNMLYVDYPGSFFTTELYDMNSDPHQLNSLHADLSSQRVFQRTVLSLWMNALKVCKGADCRHLEFLGAQ